MKKVITTAACLAALTLASTAMAATNTVNSAGIVFHPENGATMEVANPTVAKSVSDGFYQKYNLNTKFNKGVADFAFAFDTNQSGALPYGHFDLTVNNTTVPVSYAMEASGNKTYAMKITGLPNGCYYNQAGPAVTVRTQVHCA